MYGHLLTALASVGQALNPGINTTLELTQQEKNVASFHYIIHRVLSGDQNVLNSKVFQEYLNPLTLKTILDRYPTILPHGSAWPVSTENSARALRWLIYRNHTHNLRTEVYRLCNIKPLASDANTLDALKRYMYCQCMPGDQDAESIEDNTSGEHLTIGWIPNPDESKTNVYRLGLAYQDTAERWRFMRDGLKYISKSGKNPAVLWKTQERNHIFRLHRDNQSKFSQKLVANLALMLFTVIHRPTPALHPSGTTYELTPETLSAESLQLLARCRHDNKRRFDDPLHVRLMGINYLPEAWNELAPHVKNVTVKNCHPDVIRALNTTTTRKYVQAYSA